MLKKMLHGIKINIDILLEKLRISLQKKNEINKMKDARRKEIYSSVILTQEEKNQIDDLFVKNYGKKIQYIWHQFYYAYNKKFDKNFMPDLIYSSEIEYFMNYNKEYCKVFENKNILPHVANSLGIVVPKTIVSCSQGLCRGVDGIITKDEIKHVLNDIGEVFVKPSIDSDSGRGCFILDVYDGVDKNSNKKIDEVIEELGDNFLIQEKIICHKSISMLYKGSVNTFRVITYRFNNTICHCPAILRIGCNGSTVDNAHAGGMFIAVNDDGRLHKTAFTEFMDKFEEHPNSHIKFLNHQIYNFPNVIQAAKKIHSVLPELGIVNWDFTIDKEGNPILIEANILGGSIWLIQMAHGCGAFGNNTDRILRWIKKTKKMDIYAKRRNYLQ